MNLLMGLQKYYTKIGNYNFFFKCKYQPGSNEAILFIHGLGCSGDSFINLFNHDYFPSKSLIVVDLLGFGKSEKPEDFSYSMEDQAKIIEELLKLLPDWNYHIAAHSMGGAVALLFQPNTYSRVSSFANIEGNLVPEDCGLLSRGVISVSYNEYKNDLYKKQLNEFKGHQQLHFEESTPFAVYKSAVSLVKWSDGGELLEKFKNLTCRKSYFYGEENKHMPVLEQLGSVPKYMIGKSGHGMMTENPEEFYSKLAGFIEYQ